MKPSRTVIRAAAVCLAIHALTPSLAQSQTTTVWDGGPNGSGTSWATAENWVGDSALPNATNSNVLIDNRVNPGTISTLTISNARTLGLITFDNVNSVLASTLNVDTNGSGTTARTLTLHGGITLRNTATTVAFRGNNGTLSVVLGANNIFTTSTGSYLQINSGVVIDGGFGITVAGAGATGLNAPNTFTGGVTVQTGSTLRVGAGTQGNSSSSTVTAGVLVSGQVGTGTLALQNGSTIVSGGSGARTLNNNLTLEGSVTFGAAATYTGSLTFTSVNSTVDDTLNLTTPSTIALLGHTTVTSQVTTSFFNVMSGSFSLTKQGPGILRMSATNTYNGGTTVASGTLEFGRTGSLGTGTVTLGSAGGGNASLLNYLAGWTLTNNIIVAAGSGGTLTLGYTSSAAFSGLFSGSITLNDALTLRSDAADGFALRLSGSISGAYDLTKTGSGTVRIEANNAGFSGRTLITAGTVQLGSLSGSTAGALGSGEIVNDATLVINRTNDFTLGNLISGTGSITQTGTGTTTLTAANTYSGATSLSAGSLLAANASGSATGSGAVSTSAGTTLGGTGTIAPGGTSGVIIGGAVAPGVPGTNDGVGTLTFKPVDGNVSFQNGSSVAFQIRANGDNDRIVFNASGSGLLNFSQMTAGSISVTFTGGYTPGLNDSFDLLDWTSVSGAGVSGLSASLLNLSTAGFDPSWSWDTTAFSSSGVISITLVPEPHRSLLLAGAGVLMLLRRRR